MTHDTINIGVTFDNVEEICGNLATTREFIWVAPNSLHIFHLRHTGVARAECRQVHTPVWSGLADLTMGQLFAIIHITGRANQRRPVESVCRRWWSEQGERE